MKMEYLPNWMRESMVANAPAACGSIQGHCQFTIEYDKSLFAFFSVFCFFFLPHILPVLIVMFKKLEIE